LGDEFNQDEATVYIEFVMSEQLGKTLGLLSIYNEAVGFRDSRSFSMVLQDDNKIDYAMNGDYISVEHTALLQGSVVKAAIAANASGHTIAVNGEFFNFATPTTTATLDSLLIGRFGSATNGPAAIKKIIVIPARLTSTDLAVLTGGT
jgi:hypothetical protein